MLPGIFHFSILSHFLSLVFPFCVALRSPRLCVEQHSEASRSMRRWGSFFFWGAVKSEKLQKLHTNLLSSLFVHEKKKCSTNFTKDREFSREMKVESCVENLLLFSSPNFTEDLKNACTFLLPFHPHSSTNLIEKEAKNS